MPRPKWTKRQYAQAAKALRRFGYNISYKANDRKTFHQRGVIRRVYEAKKDLINFTEPPYKRALRVAGGIQYNYKFQRFGKKNLARLKRSGVFTSELFTPTGLWIEKPLNIPARQYKVRLTRKGDVRFTGRDRDDVIVPLNTKRFVVDANAEIDRVLSSREEPQTYSLICGKYSSGLGFTKKQLSQYLKDDLLRDWLEEGGRYYREGNTPEKFTDVFKIRFLYRNPRRYIVNHADGFWNVLDTKTNTVISRHKTRESAETKADRLNDA